MIDTVCLLIPKDKIAFTESSGTDAPNWDLHSSNPFYKKLIKNPTQKMLESGKVYPRITTFKRGYSTDACIRVEFSVSKLVYQNNLDELEEKDFKLVVVTLQERLSEMGVGVDEQTITDAKVVIIHYSKNIILEDGHTATQVIADLNKINARKNIDISRARYINDGQSLYLHTSSCEIIIYDKIADVKKSIKRAIDRDTTDFQKHLGSKLKNRRNIPEVLRIEIRLSKKKIDEMLKEMQTPKDCTFASLFSEEKHKFVVNKYWKCWVLGKSRELFILPLSNKDILQILANLKSQHRPNKLIYMVGLYSLARDGNGVRELRTILSKTSTDRTWYRIAKDLEFILESLNKNPPRKWVSTIESNLEHYKALKITNIL